MKTNRTMQRKIVVIGVLLMTLPLLAEAAGAPRTFHELAANLVDLLSAGVATLLLLGVVIYLWGIASHMAKLGEGDAGAFRSFVLWGIIILFVMVSIWGILNLLRATLFQDQVVVLETTSTLSYA